jgi:hypothetical protein
MPPTWRPTVAPLPDGATVTIGAFAPAGADSQHVHADTEPPYPSPVTHLFYTPARSSGFTWLMVEADSAGRVTSLRGGLKPGVSAASLASRMHDLYGEPLPGSIIEGQLPRVWPRPGGGTILLSYEVGQVLVTSTRPPVPEGGRGRISIIIACSFGKPWVLSAAEEACRRGYWELC